MKTITEADIAAGLEGSDNYWAYNGLDCCVTRGVHDHLAPVLSADPNDRMIADFELACQSPAMAMMLRGAAFDESACSLEIRELEKDEKRLTGVCRSLIGDL